MWIIVVLKSDWTDKINHSFFPGDSRINTGIQMHHMDAILLYREKAWRQLRKNAESCIEQALEATPHKTAAVAWPPTTHHKNYPS